MQSDRVRDSLNARVASIVFDFSGILSSSATSSDHRKRNLYSCHRHEFTCEHFLERVCGHLGVHCTVELVQKSLWTEINFEIKLLRAVQEKRRR